MKRFHSKAVLAVLLLAGFSVDLHSEFLIEAKSVAVAGEQTVEVTWAAETGWLYFAQTTESLEEDSWVYLSKAVVGTNELGVLTFFPEQPDEPESLLVRVLRTADLGGDGLSQDNDGDGLDNQGEFDHQTDPLDPDSDGDGLLDGFEVTHGFAPLDDGTGSIDNGGNGDPDGDGWSNLAEQNAGTDPNGHADTTDSDGDGVMDRVDAVPGDEYISWERTPESRYVWIDLDDPPAGLDPGSLVAVNNQGTVLFDKAVWKEGEWTELDMSQQTAAVSDGSLSWRPMWADGLNDADQIVGTADLWDFAYPLSEMEPLLGTAYWSAPDAVPQLSGAALWYYDPDPAETPGTYANAPGGIAADGSVVLLHELINLPGSETAPVFDGAGAMLTSLPQTANLGRIPDVTPGGSVLGERSDSTNNYGHRVWQKTETGYQVHDLPPDVLRYHLAELANGRLGVPAYPGYPLYLQDNAGAFGVSPSLPEALLLSRNGAAVTQDSTTGELSIWRNGEETLLADLCGRAEELLAEGYHLGPVDINDSGALLIKAMDQSNEGPRGLLLPIDIVPDYNRDGAIDAQDWGKVTEANPWRWWINDDNDRREGECRGNNDWDIPGPPEPMVILDWVNTYVDGVRDLLDFFPLHLDLGAVLTGFPENKYRYLLKHEEEAFRFYEFPPCVLDGSEASGAPNAYLKSIGIAQHHAWNKELKLASVEGAALSTDMLDGAEQGKGVVVVEGRKITEKPLVLEIVRKSDNHSVAEFEFPVETSGVEDMFRHVNMRDLTEEPATGRETKVDEPDNYPDGLTNGKYVAYIHGFNVEARSARGSQSNIFKRLHQLGSKARYIGVTWNGTPSNPGVFSTVPDYHRAMDNGLITGVSLKQRLAFTWGSDLTIIAHSLGNSVAGNAIAHFGLQPSRYFIVNGAISLEAYDPDQRSFTNSAVPNEGDDMARNMTDNDWKPYYDFGRAAGQTGDFELETGAFHGQARLLSRNWHRLFPDTDKRSELTWRGYFAEPQVLSIAHNFYSPGDEVVENASSSEAFDENTWSAITSINFARHSWINQEMAKGGRTGLENPLFHDINGGWGFNYQVGLFGATGYYKYSALQYRKYYPSEARDEITEAMLRTKPFHLPFFYPDLYDPATGSATAGDPANKYKLLGTGIPASSFAIAANHVDRLDDYNDEKRNYNMQEELKHAALSWPAHPNARTTNAWAHSDFKDVCIQLVHPLYKKWIDLGKLDED